MEARERLAGKARPGLPTLEGGGLSGQARQPKDSIMEGNGNTPYFRYALEKYMRRHGLEACDPCSLPAYILTGLLREAKERRAQHDASRGGPQPAIAVASPEVPAQSRLRKM
jgi:hypothetical protein